MAMVPAIIPPTTQVPIAELPLAPAPCANTNGTMPIIITLAVITIGRKRTEAAESVARTMEKPSLRRRSVAYCVSRIAVFASIPMSITKPICV